MKCFLMKSSLKYFDAFPLVQKFIVRMKVLLDCRKSFVKLQERDLRDSLSHKQCRIESYD